MKLMDFYRFLFEPSLDVIFVTGWNDVRGCNVEERQLHNQREVVAIQIRMANIYIFTFYKPLAMSIIQLRSCVFDVVDARGQLRALSLILNNHSLLSFLLV